ncbi:hypothetical protein ACVWZ6_002407 [Bradyrhizobium sp. GM6.1]
MSRPLINLNIPSAAQSRTPLSASPGFLNAAATSRACISMTEPARDSSVSDLMLATRGFEARYSKRCSMAALFSCERSSRRWCQLSSNTLPLLSNARSNAAAFSRAADSLEKVSRIRLTRCELSSATNFDLMRLPAVTAFTQNGHCAHDHARSREFATHQLRSAMIAWPAATARPVQACHLGQAGQEA